jgi:large subunit ribosomal protein L10
MNKEQKTAVIEELSAELSDADAIFAIDYRGISVPQAAELRSGLRDADARFRVVKNRLTLLAAEKAGTEGIKDHLTGPTALALVQGDVALAAKTIRNLGDEWELLEFKGGIMDGAPLEPDSFVAIAKLPGRDQLNAQFAGIVASPITGLVRGLGSMVSGLASQLQQIADKGLVAGEADPEPADSPEESPSQEDAPEGEDAGEQVPETGEGDAEPAEAEEAAAPEETSEDSDKTKEDE